MRRMASLPLILMIGGAFCALIVALWAARRMQFTGSAVRNRPAQRGVSFATDGEGAPGGTIGSADARTRARQRHQATGPAARGTHAAVTGSAVPDERFAPPIAVRGPSRNQQ